jgi:putative ABC transport system substrate-binding protein
MKRRDLTGRLLAVLACGPCGRVQVAAQPTTRLVRIGVLRFGVPGDDFQVGLTAALAALGYHEGRTIQSEWRWATRAHDAQRHAAELAGMKLDLIVASTTPAALAMQAAKPQAPIVLAGADAVGAGLVATLAQPGGNITGVSLNLTALVPKHLELLREAIPGLKRAAFLGSTEDRATPLFAKQAQDAAASLGLSMQPVLVSQAAEFAAATAAMARDRIQAVVVQPLFAPNAGPLAEALSRQRLPSISSLHAFATGGGLMTYGPNRSDLYKRIAAFADRLLKGAKAADLPVEEPTLYDLVLNLKTAQSIGLAIPPSLRRRADEVIQ